MKDLGGMHLMSDVQLAELYNVSVATIRRWRLIGQGPAHVKIGGAVRYRSDVALEFLETHARGGAQV